MICLKCAIAIDDSTAKTYIRCDGCNRPIHTSCSDLTTNELKCLDLRPNSRRRIKYICVECEQGISQLPKLLSLIADLKDEISKLKEFNTNLSLKSSTSTPKDNSISLSAKEEIIQEITERSKRANNLIIYRVVENGTTKIEQLEQDTALIQSLTSDLGLGDQQIKPIRLGKFDRSRQPLSRPIKVHFSSPEIVHNIVRKFKTLRTNDKYSALAVSYDRTPKQAELYKAVKNDLNTRLQHGESNLKIIYRNGTPTIVSSDRPEN
ncbi:hypothetical protein Zmor_015380 [Zophobas morio]|uniref:PHD-type domain-containing protein n=1 Tax=Zophobas morio TaxID=2755281 RepID=A0AA38IE36_9CUCU|nr:hypothetical protein Zmor_015380 [Zophobas morio]